MKTFLKMFMLVMGIVVAMATTSCSSSDENEPTTNSLAETAWQLEQIIEVDAYSGTPEYDFMEYGDVFVFHKGNDATLYLLEVDFEKHKCSYTANNGNIEIIWSGYEDDCENYRGTYTINGDELTLKCKEVFDEDDIVYTTYIFKKIPYKDAEKIANQNKEYWGCDDEYGSNVGAYWNKRKK